MARYRGNITLAPAGARAKRKVAIMPSLDEKKQKLEQQIAQKKAQLKKLQNRQRKQERAARTRRLIQRGALAEKFLNCPDDLPQEDFEKLLAQIVSVPQVQELLPAPDMADGGPPAEYKTKSGKILTDDAIEEMGTACERGEYPGTKKEK